MSDPISSFSHNKSNPAVFIWDLVASQVVSPIVSKNIFLAIITDFFQKGT